MPNFKQAPMDPAQVMMSASSVDESIGCPAYPPKVLTKILVYVY